MTDPFGGDGAGGGLADIDECRLGAGGEGQRVGPGDAVDGDFDVVVAQEAARAERAVGGGDAAHVGPPLAVDQIFQTAAVGLGGPIAAQHGGRGSPMRALPEAPDHEAFHGGMAEAERQEVARVVGLHLFVGDGDIEFGDLQVFAEGGELIDQFEHAGRRREVGIEVRLQADAVDGRARGQQIPDDAGVAVDVLQIVAAGLEDVVVVDVELDAGIGRAGLSKPGDHFGIAEHVLQILVGVGLVEHVPLGDLALAVGHHVGDVFVDAGAQGGGVHGVGLQHILHVGGQVVGAAAR